MPLKRCGMRCGAGNSGTHTQSKAPALRAGAFNSARELGIGERHVDLRWIRGNESEINGHREADEAEDYEYNNAQNGYQYRSGS